MIAPDTKARKRALTDFAANILVEAAAGTGKTSLMAGRVAMMMASGINPANIAAITFTELAASELEARIRWTVDQLRAGKLPPALTSIIKSPLKASEHAALEAAAPHLVNMTVTTIHGFCQVLLRAEGLEIGLDPGARVVDAVTADAIFDEVLDLWLKAKLSDDAEETHPAAILARDDPLGIVKRIRELAYLKRAYPDATAPTPNGHAGAVAEFSDAVEEFGRWYAAHPGDQWTADLVGDLERLTVFFAENADNSDFETLWRLAQPPRIPIMRKNSLVFSPYKRAPAWRDVFGKEEGGRRADVAEALFDRADSAYRSLIGVIAEELVHDLSLVLDELMEAYGRRKDEIAILDFDDLLRRARYLVCEHPAIRERLSSRYRYLLVDEFQDTDPIQAEIVFSLASETTTDDWTNAILRPGALFIVGDPKQAIYRFRGADIESYKLAKTVISKTANGHVLDVTANFRSRPQIIDHVNDAFQNILAQPGQPGFVPLTATIEASPLPFPAAAKITIEVPRDAKADEQREAEAAAVADLCARLIGSISIVDARGEKRLLRAGDIALLAPTHTDLWRYERALEAERISVSSQAGKALFQRQELQDILALVRTLADPLDTAAFGALMRGPTVGLTDEDLLDITLELSPDADGRRRFQLRTPPVEVKNPLARDILVKLQELHQLAPAMTPMQLLALAIERLNLRVMMAARHGQRNARAIANLDAVAELARPHDVAGLRAFALDLQRGREEKRLHSEGRVDASDDSVEIVTMHSAKGLEWPVVIPINSSTVFRMQDQFVYRQSDRTLHWIVGGIESAAMAAAREEDEFREARQRERLWYVATTRARDLLVIPYLPGAAARSWSRVMDLGQGRLSEIPVKQLLKLAPVAPPARDNGQTAGVFASEVERIRAASPEIIWERPSRRDADRKSDLDEPFVVDPETPGQEQVRGAGALRGAILHKVMEEFLTGELLPDEELARLRCDELLQQLVALQGEPNVTPEPQEMAKTAFRTYRMPELAPFVGDLIPELSLWSANPPRYLAGRADAAIVTDEGVSLVIDWKSDIDPKLPDHGAHVAQVRDYLHVTGARRGALIYMSLGKLVWVEPSPSATDGPRSP